MCTHKQIIHIVLVHNLKSLQTAAHEGHPGDQAQSTWVHERQVLLYLISFYDKVTRLVDEGKAVDVVYLDFSKAFDAVSHSMLLEKLAAHGLDGSTLCWVKNWLEVRAQRVVVNGVKSSWRPDVSLSMIWMRGLSAS
ncbi:rna-directed dna polymerase from mobile element jockey-like [Limosa lapponica baueri]|uniref:Rna-directed dna polymerase from mobile element jockey-like n=1 Tax=Limosa lapponica baueri TaxID=1758121 RepID=A0A2I0U878_LIMLA|nr:rna-directed dna polymerase from mobile element jockey-like [Limosa lapponica baueri]